MKAQYHDSLHDTGPGWWNSQPCDSRQIPCVQIYYKQLGALPCSVRGGAHVKETSKERRTMSTPTNRRRGQSEEPSTYFVQNRLNKEELTRLTIQDQFIPRRMGGGLPEQPNQASLRRVLVEAWCPWRGLI